MPKSSTVKFLESEDGKALIDAVKNLSEGIKGLENFFKNALPLEEFLEPVGRRARKKRTRDPDAPKQPLSAYILFAQKTRADVKQSNPEMQPKDMMVELGRLWREETSEEVKQALLDFKDEAESLREQFQIENEEYTKLKSEALALLPGDDSMSEDESHEVVPEVKKHKSGKSKAPLVPEPVHEESADSSSSTSSGDESESLASVKEPVKSKDTAKSNLKSTPSIKSNNSAKTSLSSPIKAGDSKQTNSSAIAEKKKKKKVLAAPIAAPVQKSTKKTSTK